MVTFNTEDDKVWIDLWNEHKSASKLSKILGKSVRNIYERRRTLEQRYGIELQANFPYYNFDANAEKEKLQKKLNETRSNVRRGINLENGRIIVFSDAHFFPDTETTAYFGLLEAIKEFQPEVIIANGDIFDGSSISRFPRIMFSDQPTVLQELDAVISYMNEIEGASKFKSNLIHTLGNHDARYETFLSANVPQYQGIKGFHLKDHLPLWQPCWSFWINEDTCIKHRWKGGWTGGRSNTLNSGVNMVTGHTHAMNVIGVTDYNGTRWGVQTGTLADPHGQQFNYTEDAPKDWMSGFVMLSFHNGKMLQPEMIRVWDNDSVEFRGKIHNV